MLMILPAPLGLPSTSTQQGTFARWVVRESLLKFQRSRGVDTGGGGRGSSETEDRGEAGYENRRKKEKERTRGEEERSERQRTEKRKRRKKGAWAGNR